MNIEIAGVVAFLLVLFWIVAGISAFVMSLVCFGYRGTSSDKFIGLLMSFIFGPFYWLYYSYNDSYCKS